MPKSTELGPNQRKWLRALRSGKYRQTRKGFLHDKRGFCCLGVACELFKTPTTKIKKVPDSDDGAISYSGNAEAAPGYVIRALGLMDDQGTPYGTGLEKLTILNDGLDSKDAKTFKQIAAIVEANPKAYFKKPL